MAGGPSKCPRHPEAAARRITPTNRVMLSPQQHEFLRQLAASFAGQAIIIVPLPSSGMTPMHVVSDLTGAIATGSTEAALPAPSQTAAGEEVSTLSGRAVARRRVLTIAERAEEILRETGDEPLSRNEWVKRLGEGSGRLVDDLIRSKQVIATGKGTGKGHRARFIRPSHLVPVLMQDERGKRRAR